MDRWNIVITLNYLPAAVEAQIVLAKSGEYDQPEGKETVEKMVRVADLTRKGFVGGDMRSEEHTPEIQSLMRTSYAVFCLKKNKITLEYLHHSKSERLIYSSIIL